MYRFKREASQVVADVCCEVVLFANIDDESYIGCFFFSKYVYVGIMVLLNRTGCFFNVQLITM